MGEGIDDAEGSVKVEGLIDWGGGAEGTTDDDGESDGFWEVDGS